MLTLEQEDKAITEQCLENSLDDRMKVYEKRELRSNLPTDRPILVRLDGNCFSKFTTSFPTSTESPFNEHFTNIMVATATSLMDDVTFRPRLAYTHSDEITLLFDEFEVFNNRTQKWMSLLSSKASAYFQLHMRSTLNQFSDHWNDHPDKFDTLIRSAPAFDARVIFFPVGREIEVVNYFIWRSQRDCFKNCVSTWAEKFYPKKSLNGLTTTQRLDKLESENGVKEDDIPLYHRHGVFIKKNLVTIEMEDPCKAGQLIDVVRSKLVHWSMKFTFAAYLLDIFRSKYHEEEVFDQIEKEVEQRYAEDLENESDESNSEESESEESESEESESKTETESKYQNVIELEKWDAEWQFNYTAPKAKVVYDDLSEMNKLSVLGLTLMQFILSFVFGNLYGTVAPLKNFSGPATGIAIIGLALSVGIMAKSKFTEVSGFNVISLSWFTGMLLGTSAQYMVRESIYQAWFQQFSYTTIVFYGSFLNLGIIAAFFFLAIRQINKLD